MWSRIYIINGELHMDIGRGGVVQLPAEETQKRLEETTEEWPISNVVLYDIAKDQFLARHKANHVCMAYADDAEMALQALFYKKSLAENMGIKVHVCGSLEKTLKDIQPEKYRTGGIEALPYRNRLSDLPLAA